MSKLLPILLALGFIAMSASAPVFAQKQSCQEVCAKRCEMPNYSKSLCIANCNSKCNQNRSEKKK